jgi:hypothetical protein
MYAENKKKNGFFPFSFFSVFPENLFFQGWRNVFEKISVDGRPPVLKGFLKQYQSLFLFFFSCRARFFAKPLQLLTPVRAAKVTERATCLPSLQLPCAVLPLRSGGWAFLWNGPIMQMISKTPA